MIVASLEIAQYHDSFGNGAITYHRIPFDRVDTAEEEYRRIVTLITDLPQGRGNSNTLVEIEGAGSRVTLPINAIKSIAFNDYAIANAQEVGVRDAFPHLFKK